MQRKQIGNCLILRNIFLGFYVFFLMLPKKNVKFLANWKEVCYYVYIKQKKWGVLHKV